MYAIKKIEKFQAFINCKIGSKTHFSVLNQNFIVFSIKLLYHRLLINLLKHTYVELGWKNFVYKICEKKIGFPTIFLFAISNKNNIINSISLITFYKLLVHSKSTFSLFRSSNNGHSAKTRKKAKTYTYIQKLTFVLNFCPHFKTRPRLFTANKLCKQIALVWLVVLLY